MTKLLEWLTAVMVVFGVWITIVLGYVQSPLTDKWMHIIIPSPIIFVILFGLYAVFVVLYRVFTFNDCEYAAKELQGQIVQAREDLKQKGFAFD
ncbi:dolichyl-phosphate mannosyltransferase subunit 3 [Arctopsyche grandis]|uniref:dolichyl-phosphate mannosyltransferase subunit 3 n=1 Tax=Arctopsyche grandis TaxID=121162 RepID=UPI00406D7CEA